MGECHLIKCQPFLLIPALIFLAELVIAEVISLARRSLNRNMELHQGIWHRVIPNATVELILTYFKAVTKSHEIKGKQLGNLTIIFSIS